MITDALTTAIDGVLDAPPFAQRQADKAARLVPVLDALTQHHRAHCAAYRRLTDVLGPGDRISITAAQSQDSNRPAFEVLLLGGRPIRESVAWMGPFVMNTRDEVMQAMADYQAGRLGTIPAVHGAPTILTESAPAER